MANDFAVWFCSSVSGRDGNRQRHLRKVWHVQSPFQSISNPAKKTENAPLLASIVGHDSGLIAELFWALSKTALVLEPAIEKQHHNSVKVFPIIGLKQMPLVQTNRLPS